MRENNDLFTHITLKEKQIKGGYSLFPILKRNGKNRWINSPSTAIRSAQKSIYNTLAMMVSPSINAYGGVRGRGTMSVAKAHVANQPTHFLLLDLTNFYPNTRGWQIRQALKEHSNLSNADLDKVVRCGLMYNKRKADKDIPEGDKWEVPQGGITSAFLTNMTMKSFDIEAERAVKKYLGPKAVYARYIDDISISCNRAFTYGPLVKEFTQMLKKLGYSLNYSKTLYTSISNGVKLLGHTITRNEDGTYRISANHKRARAFDSLLYRSTKAFQNNSEWDVDVLMGHYAYLCGVERSKVDQVKSKVSKKLKFDLISFIADRGGAFEWGNGIENVRWTEDMLDW